MFKILLNQLFRSSTMFYLNKYPIPRTFSNSSFISKDRNFGKRIELRLSDRFIISLKQGDSEPCNISGSPHLIEKLITAQGLNAHFGRADHSNRKRSAYFSFCSKTNLTLNIKDTSLPAAVPNTPSSSSTLVAERNCHGKRSAPTLKTKSALRQQFKLQRI
jgi:hypothetical protein